MPPKKEAKERLRKEEAERKAREEEELRRQEELARQEEEKRIQEAQETRKRRKEEERVRFLEVNERLGQEMMLKMEALDKWKKDNLKKLQWDHFLSCSSIPDPTDEKAMNTYLSLSEEEITTSLIQDTMATIQDWLKICDMLQQIMQADGLPDSSIDDSARYQQVVSQLQALILNRLDQVTLLYMSEAEKHVDSETFNLSVEAGLEHRLKYSLWGNVVKDPRVKSFSFKDQFQLTLELPKSLLLADVAVRMMQVDFDPLSPQSRTVNNAIMTNRSNLSTAMSAMSSHSGTIAVDEQDLAEYEEGGALVPGVVSAVPSTRQEAVSHLTVEDMGGDGGGERVPSSINVGFDDVEKEIPIIEFETPQEENQVQEDEVDLRGFQPARGPIFLHALELPPQPKSINKWTVKKILPQDLPLYMYPAQLPRPPPPAPGEEAVIPPAPVPGSTAWPPVTINMKLPQPYIYPEEPQIALWDKAEKIWRTKGVSNAQFDMDEKEVSFQTFYFCPFAVIVDQYANMPYTTWKLLPAKQHTLFTIEGGAAQITLKIQDDKSTLVGARTLTGDNPGDNPDNPGDNPTDETPFSHLLDRPMSAKQLIASLKCMGANFFPAVDAEKYVSVSKKRSATEMALYKSMALASCGWGFQWSRWNCEISPGKFVLQVAEGTDEDKMAWYNYASGKKSFRLGVTEDSEAFSPERAEDSLTYPDLYSALEQASSPAVKRILNETSPKHFEAVQYWLDNTKVLTFT